MHNYNKIYTICHVQNNLTFRPNFIIHLLSLLLQNTEVNYGIHRVFCCFFKANKKNKVQDEKAIPFEEISANVHHFSNLIEKQDLALSQTNSAMEKMSSSVNEVTKVTGQKMAATGKLQETIGKGWRGNRSYVWKH